MIREALWFGNWNHIYAVCINPPFPQLEGMRTKRGHGSLGRSIPLADVCVPRVWLLKIGRSVRFGHTPLAQLAAVDDVRQPTNVLLDLTKAGTKFS
jgi:hypothetical protein